MSVAQSVFKSAFFSSAGRFFSKIIGFISTLILARILTPEDFAAIAIISICLYFFDVLSHVGSEQYIMSKSELLEEDIFSAWTLDIALKVVVVIGIFVFSAPILFFLERSELVLGLQVVSCVLLLNALKSPAIFLLKRTLNYQPIFVLTLIQKLSSFIVVIVLAFELDNYWAFIWADIVGAFVFLIFSYILAPHPIKICFTGIAKQWLFSKWLLSKGIVGYLRSQVDTLLVSKFFNANMLGNYHLSRDIAMLPAHNILAPAIEPLLAAFSQEKNNKEKFNHNFLLSLFVTLLIATPIALYFASVPDLIVRTLLGEQWAVAGGLLEIFSLLFFYWVLLLVLENAFIALNKVKLIFLFDVFSLFFIVLILAFIFKYSLAIEYVALVRTGLGALSMLTMLAVLIVMRNIAIKKVLLLFLLPLLAASVSYILTVFIDQSFQWHYLISFFVTGFSFFMSYLVVIFSLCLLFRKDLIIGQIIQWGHLFIQRFQRS